MRRLASEKLYKKCFAGIWLLAACLCFWGCDLGYGKVGGADGYTVLGDDTGGDNTTGNNADGDDTAGNNALGEFLEFFIGEWYSHHPYAEYQTDGYKIGKVKDLQTDYPDNHGYPSGFPRNTPAAGNYSPKLGSNYAITPEDHYVLYLAKDKQEPGNKDVPAFMGIVRRVHIFDTAEESREAGAIIIEFLEGCYEDGSQFGYDVSDHPFQGIFYRIIDDDTVQLANAWDFVNWEAPNTATLEEAAAKFVPENEGDLIAWGIVLPQKREPR
jgi:hypothetical protein